MVIFIMTMDEIRATRCKEFTFQYGYIYYRFVVDNRSLRHLYLHSNMVIFIILQKPALHALVTWFTFQYGYIYYYNTLAATRPGSLIYIPIWLYLLLSLPYSMVPTLANLHSNMVIFIITPFIEGLIVSVRFTFQYGYIYYGLYKRKKRYN